MKKSLFLLASFLLVACSNGQEAPSSSSSDSAVAESSQTTSDEASQVDVVDAYDHTVTVPFDPQAVAVFDFAQLDNLNALGLSDRVAVTASNELPSYLAETYTDLPTAGTLHEVDLEASLEQEPEMAIVATRSSDSYDALSEFIPTLDFSLTEDSPYQSMAYNVEALSQIFGVEEEAQSILDDLVQQKDDLAEQASSSDKTALMVMFNEGEISVYGPGGRFGHIYDDFGYTSADQEIEESNHGMQVSYEYLLEMDPDIIFVLDRQSAITEGANGEEASSAFEDHPLIADLTAKQNEDIYYVTPDAWYIGNGGLDAYQIMIDDASQPLQ